MGRILAICTSKEKGTEKSSVISAELKAGFGIVGDAHAGKWHRQVSMLSYEKIEEFRKKGAKVDYGAFGENLVTEGLDFSSYELGAKLHCGTAVLAITQFGKECHHGCRIFQQMGDCIMPREGVFAEVLEGGHISVGDEIEPE